jgi:hypothetical protein
VVGSFLLLSYWHKLSRSEAAGRHFGNVRSDDVSGWCPCLLGHFCIAKALSLASLLLLELKSALEKLATRISSEEIFTFAKF